MALTDSPPDSASPATSRAAQASHLFRLPPPLRRRIYLYLGLASWVARYPFGFDLHTGRATYETPAAASFYGLLLSCRDLYTEAATLLYSANRFFIHYTHPGPLGPLRSLTPASLASLTHLKIVLNQASCHHPDKFTCDVGFCCLHAHPDKYPFGSVYECDNEHQGLHHPPLLSSDDDGLARLRVQGILNEWHLTAAYLSAHTTSCLELSLVCDLDPQNGHALNVAGSVTAPLCDLSRPLRNCHVRLAKRPDSRLQEVARDAVLQARGMAVPYLKPSSTPAATSLMDLPRELRLQILEYTDLIVPWREVTWSRQDPGYVAFAAENSPGWGNVTPSLFNCWRIKGDAPSIGCFCRRYHSASSSACRCWFPPTPLYLVCRTLYQEALFVFFSSNEFFVHDLRSDPAWWIPGLPESNEPLPVLNPRYDYPNERLAASLFLREVTPTCALVHLRFLELVFPAYLAPSWPRAGQPAMQDWWATIRWLRDKINAPKLTVRLSGATMGQGTSRAYAATMRGAEGDAIFQAYMDIVRPFRKLAKGPNGLARVYVDFDYPWQYTETSKRREELPGGCGWLECRRREVNEGIERYIMGDRYDSLCQNDQGESEPLWRRRFYGF